MTNRTDDQQKIHDAVRHRYGELAAGPGCCAPTCCSGDPTPAETIARGLGYSDAATRSVPAGANLGLGCGNPTALAALRPGMTVLDLGSGAGFDAFLAARAVGPGGRVIGVDMTPQMLDRARRHQATGRYPNVEFRLGEIEHVPVADGSVDVVISNCVINLSLDKPAVFREAFRTLRPGGRLAIADVVALHPIPPELRADFELHAGCVAGAATAAELETMLRAAGFAEVRIRPNEQGREIVARWGPGRGIEDHVTSATIEAVRPAP